MRRRAVLTLAASAAAAVSAVAQTRRPARIGFLAGRESPVLDGLRQGLRALGHVEGKSFVIEYRSASGRSDLPPALAAELVALGVDVIVTNTTTTAVAARQATQSVPIVISMLGDPVGLGLVASLARPGGNVTGIAGVTAELSGKRLQLLKEVAPQATRVVMLTNPALANMAQELAESESAARQLDLRLTILSAASATEIHRMLDALRTAEIDAVLVPPNALLATQPHMGQLVDLLSARRLPAIFTELDWVTVGGLMAYAPDLHEFGQRIAWHVDQVLRGRPPADLPVELATRLKLVVNLRTARAIGVTVPPALLVAADEVIE